MTSARPAIGVVESPAAWLAAELEASTDWWHTFTEAEVGEIHAALEHARAADPDLDLDQLTPDRFPLPTVVDARRGHPAAARRRQGRDDLQRVPGRALPAR